MLRGCSIPRGGGTKERGRGSLTAAAAGVLFHDEVLGSGAVQEAEVQAADVVLAEVGVANLGARGEGVVLVGSADLLDHHHVARSERGHGRADARSPAADVLRDRALLLQDVAVAV